jgi:hypothetical protein
MSSTPSNGSINPKVKLTIQSHVFGIVWENYLKNKANSENIQVHVPGLLAIGAI